MAKVNVGVLGSGDVGRVLASGFMSLGHEVKIGSRDPGKLREWLESTADRISGGSFEEAAKFGDLIVLATHLRGIRDHGAQSRCYKFGREVAAADALLAKSTNPR